MSYLRIMKTNFNLNCDITKLGLFGSYARDEQNENSDIDLLIEFAPDTELLYEKKEEIKKAIRSEFRREVNLCREKYIKPYFRQQILNSVIYV